MKQLISIVAPMFNEENLIEEYVESTKEAMSYIIPKYDFEIILVNDGSSDNTYSFMNDIYEKYGDFVSLICLNRNYGLESAIYTGMKYAKGDAVVVMDADLQDPPAVILDLITKWEEGYDIVSAKRKKRPYDTFFKKITASMYYKVLDILSDRIKLEHNAANFRLLSRKAINTLLSMPEVNPVFRVMVPLIGMKSTFIEYDRDKRFAGTTKFNIVSMISYAKNSITGLSVTPLRKISIISIISAFICIISIILIFLVKEYKQAFIVCSIVSLLFTMLFVSISIISEYIAQIFIEIKQRPIALVYEYKPSINAQRRSK